MEWGWKIGTLFWMICTVLDGPLFQWHSFDLGSWVSMNFVIHSIVFDLLVTECPFMLT